MKLKIAVAVLAVAVLSSTTAAFAQAAPKSAEKSTATKQDASTKKPGIVEAAELKQVVPTNYFFDDQVAPVQMRNSAAIRTQDNKVIAAGLVDNSGYSSDVAQKYQGFLITSKKINIEGKDLAPGQYGMGFTKDGQFRVLDVSTNEVLAASCHTDDALKRPSPLKIVASGSDYRLYAGKKYVTIKVQ